MQSFTISEKIPIIARSNVVVARSNVVGALHNPKGSTIYEKVPQVQVKVGLSWYSGEVCILLYPLKPSKKEKKHFIDRVSKT